MSPGIRVRLGAVALATLAAAPANAQSAEGAPGAGPEYDVYVTGDERVAERVATTRVVDAERIEERKREDAR